MTADRWRRVEDLYHAARERRPGERGRFLEQACADDELRAEVEALLECDAEADGFLEAAALEVTAEALAEGRTRSMRGRTLGPYEIYDFIGAGGMGEVYRARDPRIARDVAIKVLPPRLAAHAERLRRFEQEARAAGALSHPNIVTIYDVGIEDGAPYVVYELLEGETLRERLRKGPLPRRKALESARQIAAGLAAAHEKGIIHRDLKPENVFATRDGRVKILDFGLAKLKEGSPEEEAGSMLGTPGYIAPEQLRGGAPDQLADLFNAGAVLYEMLTGRRPFAGRSTTEILTAIETSDPMESPELTGVFDPGVSRLLRRCLEKNPSERFQSALDLAFDLETLLLPVEAPRSSRRWGRAVAVAAGFGAILLGAFWSGRKLERANSASAAFHRLTYRLGVITAARFSPDGQSVIYSAGWDGKPVEIFRMRLGGPESEALRYPQSGVLAVSARGELAMSLGCELNWAECRGTAARVPLAGGAPREVLEDVFYADWAPDGKNMAVARAVDGRFRLEYPPGKSLYETGGWITHPRFSPKGDRIAFLDHPTLGEDNGSVDVVDLDGRRTVLSAGWKNLKGLAWSASGDELWFSGDRIARSQAIYGVTLSGRERRVLQAPGWMRLQDTWRDGRALVLQASPRSRIVFARRGGPEKDLSWFDWSTAADLSADGKKLLFYEWGEGVAGNPTVYLRDTEGGEPVRLGEGRALALSPDGKWALALRPGPPARLALLPTGPGEERLLAPLDRGELYSAAWFPDGRRILFVAAGHDGRPRSYTQDTEGGSPKPIGDDSEQAMLVSPDGKWVAGIGPDGYELLPVSGGAPAPIRGALIGDELIQWSADGRFLFVRGPGEAAFEFSRIELASGRRQVWRRIAAADPVGFIGLEHAGVRMTSDGMSFVYTYWKTLTELYLVDGLK